MQTRLKGLWEKIKGFFAKLNKKTRVLLGVCAGVLLVLAVAAVIWNFSREKEYEVLWTGLTDSEITTVSQFLSDSGVTDFKISGDSILVPEGRAARLQVQLVTSGQLNSGYLYEFYTQNTGAFSTEAERKEAIRIATQERLAAMIRDFVGVRDAQVNITLGTDRYYVLQPTVSASSAAVKITPEGKEPLSSGVVEAIRFMVSHSVEELNINDVSIVDTNGNVYDDANNSFSNVTDANALQRQYEQDINNQVRTQVLRALEPIYGEGNVSVSVNTRVDVDRRIIESTEYTQPPGSVEGGGLIGQEQWYWATGSNEDLEVGGTVGAGPNSDVITYPEIGGDLEGEGTGAAASGDRKHLVDSTITQREMLAARITDVNVAVSVNQNSENAGALSIEDLNSHVAVASGIGTELENWGAHVSVRIAPFEGTQPFTPGEQPGGTPSAPIIPGIPNWVLFAAAGGLLLFIILLVVIMLLRRRSKKKKLAAEMAAAAELQAAEAAAAAEAAMADIAVEVTPTGGADIMEINTEKSMELRQVVRQFVQNNPEIAAQMVKSWLKGDETGGGAGG